MTSGRIPEGFVLPSCQLEGLCKHLRVELDPRVYVYLLLPVLKFENRLQLFWGEFSDRVIPEDFLTFSDFPIQVDRAFGQEVHVSV